MKIEELYDMLGEKIYSYLTIKLGSACDAEDVLQEVFCRLVRYPIRLRFMRDPKRFVFKVARNEANRFLRGKILRKTISGADPPGELSRTIQSVLAGPDPLLGKMIAEAMAALPEEQRDVVLLKAFEGLSYKEIASVCEISINTAASRYRYGLAKMREVLEGKRGRPE